MARSTRTHSAQERTALLGAMHNAVQRRERFAMAPIPALFAPVSLGRTANLLAAQPNENGAVAAARRTAAALIAGSGGSLSDVGAILSAAELAAYASEVDDAPCKFCLARESGTTAAPGPAGQDQVTVVNHGRWTIDFDPDRRVTSVTISDYEFETSPANVEIVVRRANPQNWADSPAGFFVKSEPGAWSSRRWTPGPWKSGGGDLLEETSWQWNEQMTAQMYNILRISDLAQTPGAISYNYNLNECIRSDFGFGWQRGGMDVDNGYYTLTSTRSAGRRSRVQVAARKAVRYAASADALPELASLLNYMASTVISLLMHELVYHVTDNLEGSPN